MTVISDRLYRRGDAISALLIAFIVSAQANATDGDVEVTTVDGMDATMIPNEYEGDKYPWLDAKGNGRAIAWVDIGEPISSTDALWYPGMSGDNVLFVSAVK
ncbi:unnamed protein product [Meganyctiphanes norvegica]|uniref:Uncharacterized protein n=1 Tax=Meganyctiphanes norvegica TaxID=48144 RepID=A0AAV2SD09_MEGNR